MNMTKTSMTKKKVQQPVAPAVVAAATAKRGSLVNTEPTEDTNKKRTDAVLKKGRGLLPPPPPRGAHAHAPLATRTRSELIAELVRLQAQHRELQEQLTRTEASLEQRDLDVARLQHELQLALAQLKANDNVDDNDAAAASVSQKEDLPPQDDAPAPEPERGDPDIPQDPPSEEEMGWVLEIMQARETLGAVAVRNPNLTERLQQLLGRLKAICRGSEAVTSFNLSKISGVLQACGLRQLSTPGTGNCQFYAFVEAATQLCLTTIKRQHNMLAWKLSRSEEGKLLKPMEEATAAVKRGIRGSGMLTFDERFAVGEFLPGFVYEVGRIKFAKDDTDDTYREVLRGYYNDLASNKSDVATTAESHEWGSSVTLPDGAKALGRPIYVLTQCNEAVVYQRYAPTNPSGVCSMFVSVDHTYILSFAEWTQSLLEDLEASEADPNTAPLVVILEGIHYSAVVVDPENTGLLRNGHAKQTKMKMKTKTVQADENAVDSVVDRAPAQVNKQPTISTLVKRGNAREGREQRQGAASRPRSTEKESMQTQPAPNQSDKLPSPPHRRSSPKDAVVDVSIPTTTHPVAGGSKPAHQVSRPVGGKSARVSKPSATLPRERTTPSTNAAATTKRAMTTVADRPVGCAPSRKTARESTAPMPSRRIGLKAHDEPAAAVTTKPAAATKRPVKKPRASDAAPSPRWRF